MKNLDSLINDLKQFQKDFDCNSSASTGDVEGIKFILTYIISTRPYSGKTRNITIEFFKWVHGVIAPNQDKNFEDFLKLADQVKDGTIPCHSKKARAAIKSST